MIIGAYVKLAELRAEQDEVARRRRRLADRIRRGDSPVDREAAEEVRATGWARS